jgi:hypothetical protein
MQELLLSKFPEYSGESLSKVMSKIETMNPLLKESLIKYLKEDTLDEVNLLGYTVETLRDDYHMNEVAAFLTLDWIIREPDEAIASLQKGYDTVSSN